TQPEYVGMCPSYEHTLLCWMLVRNTGYLKSFESGTPAVPTFSTGSRSQLAAGHGGKGVDVWAAFSYPLDFNLAICSERPAHEDYFLHSGSVAPVHGRERAGGNRDARADGARSPRSTLAAISGPARPHPDRAGRGSPSHQ